MVHPIFIFIFIFISIFISTYIFVGKNIHNLQHQRELNYKGTNIEKQCESPSYRQVNAYG